MDAPTPSNEQHSLLILILWVITMALIYLAIHRSFEVYLSPSRSEPPDYATLVATLLRELENGEKGFEREEARILEIRRLTTQVHDLGLSSNLREPEDIEKEIEHGEADFLKCRLHFIQLHDRALLICPELRGMHAAQCTLTPERRQIFMRAEESKTAAGEEGDRCHQELEGA